MKIKLIATLSLSAIAILYGQFALAYTESEDKELFLLCSRFPNNPKCEEIGCSFQFDPGEFEQEGKCKLIADEAGITIYKEQGDEIELLEDKRGTSESQIASDRIFSTNHQI